VIATGFEAKPVLYPSHDEEQAPGEPDGDSEERRASRGLFGTVPEVDTELPAFLRRGVTAR
jgi:hypothetical protein